MKEKINNDNQKLTPEQIEQTLAWAGLSQEEIDNGKRYAGHYDRALDMRESAKKTGEEWTMNDIDNMILYSADQLDAIKAFQSEKHLVEHRRGWTKESLIEMLELGVMTIEMDLVASADGKEFYITHQDAINSEYTREDKKAGNIKRISDRSAEELQALKESGENNRMSLTEVMEIFEPYQKLGHRLVLELKDFGQYDTPKDQEAVEDSVIGGLRNILEQNEVMDSITISTLSPGLIPKIHQEMPDASLILNTAFFPSVTHQNMKAGEKLALINEARSRQGKDPKEMGEKFDPNKDVKLNPIANKVLPGLAGGIAKVLTAIETVSGSAKREEDKNCPSGKGWWTIGLKNMGRIVVCGPEAIKDFDENSAGVKQVGHQFALTEVPPEAIQILREQREAGKEYSGMSMSGNAAVHYYASKIKPLRNWSEMTVSHYYKYVNELGANAQIQIPGKHTFNVKSELMDKKIEKQAKHLVEDIDRREGEKVIYTGNAYDISRLAIERKLARQREAARA